jgi:catechol 2,3-dioxygenase-like lactoylglutathione lyase family enzyme
MANQFQVEQVDHIELFVSDRYEAARWYERILGMRIVSEFEHWAANSRGPLMISTPKGNTKLALFEGQPQGKRKTSGYHLVAFRVNGEQFLRFREVLSTLRLKDAEENIVTKEKVSDHQGAYSIYFCDPYGHRLEITTYDYHVVKARLEA